MNKSKTVILRVEPELKARLVAEAERQGITLSERIRQILIAFPVAGKIEDDRVIEHGEPARLERLP